MTNRNQPGAPGATPSECVGFAVRKAARAIAQRYDEALAPSGLKSTQFSLLNAAMGHDGISINRLADFLVMDRTTLTRNLRPLIKEGLVTLDAGSDRRTRLVAITAKGKRRLKQALPMWRRVQDQTIAALGEQRSRRLRTDLQSIIGLSR